MDIVPLVQLALPALVGLVGAQKAPQIPIPAAPADTVDRMTILGATVIILGVVQAVQTQDPSKVDPVQLVTALGVIWGLLPRAHELADKMIALVKKKPSV